MFWVFGDVSTLWYEPFSSVLPSWVQGDGHSQFLPPTWLSHHWQSASHPFSVIVCKSLCWQLYNVNLWIFLCCSVSLYLRSTVCPNVNTLFWQSGKWAVLYHLSLTSPYLRLFCTSCIAAVYSLFSTKSRHTTCTVSLRTHASRSWSTQYVSNLHPSIHPITSASHWQLIQLTHQQHLPHSQLNC